MKNNNYINERIKNPRYTIILNGKEVKKYAFFRQAMNYCLKHNGTLFGVDKWEVLDTETGQITHII